MPEVTAAHSSYGDVSAAFQPDDDCFVVSGREPCLGGVLRQKAIWVDEATCIGCRYCAHVACNTFIIEPELGRSRAFRQDGDTVDRIQEAIDTCPVDCIYWVEFEELTSLNKILCSQELHSLGIPAPARLKRSDNP